jgi:hypothetical protein
VPLKAPRWLSSHARHASSAHAHTTPGATLPASHEGRAAFLVRGYGLEPPRGQLRAPGGEQPAVYTTVDGPAGTRLYERIIGALRCAASLLLCVVCPRAARITPGTSTFVRFARSLERKPPCVLTRARVCVVSALSFRF